MITETSFTKVERLRRHIESGEVIRVIGDEVFLQIGTGARAERCRAKLPQDPRGLNAGAAVDIVRTAGRAQIIGLTPSQYAGEGPRPWIRYWE